MHSVELRTSSPTKADDRVVLSSLKFTTTAPPNFYKNISYAAELLEPADFGSFLSVRVPQYGGQSAIARETGLKQSSISDYIRNKPPQFDRANTVYSGVGGSVLYLALAEGQPIQRGSCNALLVCSEHYAETLGAYFSERRRQCNISQETAARMLQTSQSHISNVESGKIGARTATYERFFRVVGGLTVVYCGFQRSDATLAKDRPT